MKTNQIQVELQEWMGSDRSICNSAWTSSTIKPSEKERTEEDLNRLIKMLVEQKHSTPIESVVFKFWIKMPIQTDRQHMTHRIATHNGMSGRYRTMPSEWLHTPKDIVDILTRIDANATITEYETFCRVANNWYTEILQMFKDEEQEELITNTEYKRLREFFRGVLPQNNMTERVSIFNLRSFANYQKLRNEGHAQLEIQQVAELMLQEVEKNNICPIAIKYLKENNWNI